VAAGIAARRRAQQRTLPHMGAVRLPVYRHTERRWTSKR
jgi:hypothetical protein